MENYPALLLEKESERILVIVDLHIGWEVTLAQQGIHVPSQTPRILEKTTQIVEACKPTGIVFLGDVKHAVGKVEMEEWRDVPDFFERVLGKVSDLQVILGNHDGNLEPLTPRSVKIHPSTGIIFSDDIGLFHGHAWPDPRILGCRTLVMGHIHPVVMFRDLLAFRVMRQVWVKARCNTKKLAKALLKRSGLRKDVVSYEGLKTQHNVELGDSQLIIMPSFNDFLGGQAINRKYMPGRRRLQEDSLGPILRSGSVDIDNAEVYMLDGTFLGSVRQLRSFA